MIKTVLPVFLALSLFVLFADSAAAQGKQRVRFGRGSSSATLKGSVRGYAYRDYVVPASAGQVLNVRLRSPNTFSVLSVFLPNGDNLEGALQVDQFSGELPVSGNYVIRIGMMRAQARRRGSVSNYSLTISIR